MVNNDSKESIKVRFLPVENEKTLQGPCVTVNLENDQNSFPKKCSRQRNIKNGLSMTQKETIERTVHFETIAKHCVTIIQEEWDGSTRRMNKKKTNWENDRKKTMTFYTGLLWKWFINNSQGSNIVWFPLANNGKTCKGIWEISDL